MNHIIFSLIFRCRSAFKLLEINEKFKILSPGHTVIDCGASPGSWTEIAVTETNSKGDLAKKPKGFVIGVDLLNIHPIEVYFCPKFVGVSSQETKYEPVSYRLWIFDSFQGAHLLSHADFTDVKTQNKIRELLDGRQVNCVLSDMAPNATGVRCLDQERIMDLCYNVLRFAILMSAENASLLVKIWDNGNVKKFEETVLRYYKTFKHIKPDSSRGDSAEKFLLAREFIGLEKPASA